MNPLDLSGPQFLLFYVVTLVIAILIATLMRRRLIRSNEDFGVRRITVDPYEAAYLRGGAQQAIDTAIAMLVQSKVLQVSKTDGRLSISGNLPAGAHKLEQTVFKAVDSKSGRKISDIRSSVLPSVEPIAARLKTLGLVLSDERWEVAGKGPALAVAMVLLLGIIKIAVGVSRGRPVGILVFLCILTAIIALAFFKARPLLTKLGKRVLGQLKDENAALEMTARTEPQRLASGDVALALGLFGITALAFPDDSWADLRRTLVPPSSSSSGGSSCGSSSCGSSCGGGCGGGCGGCGG
ncbi:MAG TPA: TIGR04222 domain-containing membrane protein [Blastocatellia bacterium]|nr:TIGR04222 domain-containing membrane protein [Blastocatellia bacterium]